MRVVRPASQSWPALFNFPPIFALGPWPTVKFQSNQLIPLKKPELNCVPPRRHSPHCLTVTVGCVRGRGGETGSRDVNAPHHAWLFLCDLLVSFFLLVFLPAVPHTALRRILVRTVETRLIERDLELQKMYRDRHRMLS